MQNSVVGTTANMSSAWLRIKLQHIVCQISCSELDIQILMIFRKFFFSHQQPEDKATCSVQIMGNIGPSMQDQQRFD